MSVPEIALQCLRRIIWNALLCLWFQHKPNEYGMPMTMMFDVQQDLYLTQELLSDMVNEKMEVLTELFPLYIVISELH